jgi:hypothetical protein
VKGPAESRAFLLVFTEEATRHELERLKLSFCNLIQQVEEFREADGGGVGALDESLALGAQCGYAEGHRDAVIAAGVDGCTMKILAAGHVEAILKLNHLGTHCPQILRDKGDAIRFLRAQLACVANTDAAAGIRGDGRQYRQFINQLRSQSTCDCG